jgi:hypothetical protein
MSNTPDNKPNYALRRTGAAFALGAAVVGASTAVSAINSNRQDVQQRYDNTYDINKQGANNIEFDVHPGDTATSIALKFAKPDTSQAHNLVESITHQDHDLQPGDQLEIPVALVDSDVYHPAPGLEVPSSEPMQPAMGSHHQQ